MGPRDRSAPTSSKLGKFVAGEEAHPSRSTHHRLSHLARALPKPSEKRRSRDATGCLPPLYFSRYPNVAAMRARPAAGRCAHAAGPLGEESLSQTCDFLRTNTVAIRGVLAKIGVVLWVRAE